MVNSKPDAIKRRKTQTMAGGATGAAPVGGSTIGKKGKSGGTEKEKRKSKTEDEDREKDGTSGKAKKVRKLKDNEKLNKLSAGGGAGKKKSSTRLSGGELKLKDSTFNLLESIASMRSLKVADSENLDPTSAGKLKVAVRPRPPQIAQSKLKQNVISRKDEKSLDSKLELSQKDLDLIERAKTCYEEANNIWRMAWKIICERFYTLHAPLIAVHELRDTWRRVIQQHWMDEDFRNGSYPPDDGIIQDTPPFPLALDSWSRGAIEVLPDSKRESIMDPFIRDLDADNFLPFSAGSSGRRGKGARQMEKKPIHETRERQKSVLIAHTRRKTIFNTTIPFLKDMNRESFGAGLKENELIAPNSTNDPENNKISIMSMISSTLPPSIITQLFDTDEANETYDELHKGIFGRYEIQSEEEEDDGSNEDFEAGPKNSKVKIVGLESSRPKEVTIFEEQEKQILTDEDDLKEAENLVEKDKYLEGNNSRQSSKNLKVSPSEVLPKAKSEPMVSDSSAHNYSSISQDSDSSPAQLTSSPPKHLLITEHSDREKDIPKSTLSADRLENFFASIVKNNSKDSIFEPLGSEMKETSPSTSVYDDESGSGYAYSAESLRSYDNLTDIDKHFKSMVGNFEEIDHSDYSGSIRSSSSSFQSSFSSDSEGSFSSP